MHRKPRILVIEDEESLLDAWVDRFRNQGFEVLTANDGQQALEQATTQHPDMVVIDLSISDGLSTVKKLRENKWCSKTPVMYLNSWQDTEEFEHNQNTGDDYLAYNWSLDQVVKLVKSKLEIMNMSF